MILLLLSFLLCLRVPGFSQELPSDADRYYERGQRFYNQGEYKKAEREFKKSLSVLSQSGGNSAQLESEVRGKLQEATLSAASRGQDEQISGQAAPETNPKSIPETEKPKLISEEDTDAPEVPKVLEYVIGPGDVLDISVWQEELDEEVIVRPDGVISFPLVGDLVAAGSTLTRLDLELTERLKEYIKYPEVSVLIKKFGGLKVVILGEVNFPAAYSLPGRPTVLEAIALAGGFTDDAVLSSVIVIQGGLREPKGVRVNLNRAIMRADMSQNLVLNAQDIVYVPKKFIANLNYFISQVISPISSGAQDTYTLQGLRDQRW
ncbi:polysaccharide biosynthesis/export family protein [Candidatus Omnitrophota bacterium]